MSLWAVSGEPKGFDGPEGRDGWGFKWPLAREDHVPLFTMVYISNHAMAKFDGETMTKRALEAVDTRGRSEVERHLDQELPVRVIEVGTIGDPRVTAARP